MAPRSKAHKQRLNALAQVENPERKKAQPHPDSSGQRPIIGPHRGTSKSTVIRIQAQLCQCCIPAFAVIRITLAFPFSDSCTTAIHWSTPGCKNCRTGRRPLPSGRETPVQRGWQDQNWHRQVLELLNKRLLNPLQSTKILALSVVHGYHRQEKAAWRLLAHEKDCISDGTIPESKQGRHAKVLCMSQDPGTREAMQAYINSTGRTVNAVSLAGAVTSYWTESELPEYHDKQLAERTGVEWFHRCSYS